MEKYWMWMCSVPELSWQQINQLTAYFGSPKAAYEAPEQEFDFWRKKEVAWIERFLSFRKKHEIDQVWHSMEQKGIQFISREAKGFPEKLLHLPDCPAGLFFRGRLPDEEKCSVAVVGARQCSNYGKVTAQKLGSELADAGAQIISGLALGIDGYAQKAALEAGGDSFGILGCGVDYCYPEENFMTYLQLQEQGGIISEFPAGAKPAKYHFPMRNRIISGLSDVVIIVEARAKSGSLITADLALEQGKDVYAVPGRMDDALSYGCNHLIWQGAGIVSSVQELMETLNLKKSGAQKQEKKQLMLAPAEKLVYSSVDLHPSGLQDLSEKTDLPIPELVSVLLRLELIGLVAEVSKNYYARLK